MFTKLKHLRESEPVRVWVYPLLGLVVSIALGKGYISQDDLGLIEMLVMAVLGVGGVEAVRGRVTPVRPARHVRVNAEPFEDLEDEVEDRDPGYYDVPPQDYIDAEFTSAGRHAQTEAWALPVARPFGVGDRVEE
ncbi:hypothetical protein [Rhodococcus sp. 11-3]|uniref:hypothetical protein n=1 Tax=Rhodococcus sp. 11-3 TaxID=2854796 RepID=UPI00203CB1AE|nr:hypothetical protein [Rhodococcus sp. 11-3]USC17049.1 hypothetical protein KZJ41_09355 [Rhodococcus sp. 11-3]